INFPDVMVRTTKAMSEDSKQVLRYMAQIISSIFRNDRPWIGLGSPYSGAGLKTLLWRYVVDKIRGTNNGQQPNSTVLSEWFDGLPGMLCWGCGATTWTLRREWRSPELQTTK